MRGKTEPAGISSVSVCVPYGPHKLTYHKQCLLISPPIPQLFSYMSKGGSMKGTIALFKHSWIELHPTKHKLGRSLFFFFFEKKTLFYTPQNSWPAKLVLSSKQTGVPKTSRGLWRDIARGNGYDLCDDFGWMPAHIVCVLKSIGETQTCSKTTCENKHSSAIPNKCLFEIKCWANILALVTTYRKNGIHFVNGLFAEVGTRGILTLRVVQIKGYALPVC